MCLWSSNCWILNNTGKDMITRKPVHTNHCHVPTDQALFKLYQKNLLIVSKFERKSLFSEGNDPEPKLFRSTASQGASTRCLTSHFILAGKWVSGPCVWFPQKTNVFISLVCCFCCRGSFSNILFFVKFPQDINYSNVCCLSRSCMLWFQNTK